MGDRRVNLADIDSATILSKVNQQLRQLEILQLVVEKYVEEFEKIGVNVSEDVAEQRVQKQLKLLHENIVEMKTSISLIEEYIAAK